MLHNCLLFVRSLKAWLVHSSWTDPLIQSIYWISYSEKQTAHPSTSSLPRDHGGSGPGPSALLWITLGPVARRCPPWCSHCGPSNQQLCSYSSGLPRRCPAPAPSRTGSAYAQSDPAGWGRTTPPPRRAAWRRWCERCGCACGEIHHQPLPGRSCLCGGPCGRWGTWQDGSSGCTRAGTGGRRSHPRWTGRNNQSDLVWQAIKIRNETRFSSFAFQENVAINFLI